jgi:hypothetical protein
MAFEEPSCKAMLIVEIPENATRVVCFTRLQNLPHFSIKHGVSLAKDLLKSGRFQIAFFCRLCAYWQGQ